MGKAGATIIIDIDNFDNKHYKKADYIEDPLNDGTLEGFNLIKAPITNLTRSTVKEFGLIIKLLIKPRTSLSPVSCIFFSTEILRLVKISLSRNSKRSLNW